MKIPNKSKHSRWHYVAAYAVGVSALLAQTAPVNSPSSGDPDLNDVIVLSPFEVNADEDQGYLATSTLAGSRLNMPLRDVGAAISAVTKEFLQDTNATNLNELLIYTVNTESAGLDGNALGAAVASNGYPDETLSRRNPESANRVRALAPADRARGYFTTVTPSDTYNIDRVDIARGANALLFGLGSPAGVINNTLISARTDKNFGEATLGAGSEGSYRGTLDYNHVLIDDRLAIRMALLNDRREYRQRPAFEDDKRVFLTAKANLFESEAARITLNASYEKGEIDAIRPRRTGPGDRANVWLYGGSLGYFPNEGRGPRFPENFLDPSHPRYVAPNPRYNGRIDPSQLDIPADFFDRGRDWHHYANSFRHMALVFEQDGSVPGVAGYDGFQTERQSGWVNNTGVANGHVRETLAFMTMWYINQFSSQTTQVSSFPLEVYDYTRSLIGGESEIADSEFDALDVSIQGNFFNNMAGLELAYASSEFTDQFSSPIAGAGGFHIAVDPNVQLTDGTPNPNFGRLFSTATTDVLDGRDKQESVRLTGYLAFDARKKWDNWLGKLVGYQRLSGLYSTYEREEDSLASNLAWAGEAGALAVDRVNADHQERGLRQLIYYGPSIAGAAPNGFTVQPQLEWNVPQDGDTYSIRTWDRAQQNWVTRDFAVQRVYNNGTEIGALDVESQAIVLQSNWLTDSLVTIAGWRKDTADSFSSRNPLPPGTVVDESNNGLVDIPYDMSVAVDELTRNPGQSVSGDIWSYSAVAHLSDWIWTPWDLQVSAHFSQSENFQTLAGDVNFFGEFLPPPGGESKDWGLTIATQDNRASLRINFYESDITNARTGAVSSGIVNGVYVMDFQTIQQWYDGIDTGWVTQDDIEWFAQGIPQSVKDLVNFQLSTTPSGKTVATYVNPTVRDTEDLAGSGAEVEFTVNPTRNWRIHANVAQTKAKSSNIAPSLRRYVELRTPVWGDRRTGITSRTSEKPRSPANLVDFNDTSNPNYPNPAEFTDITSLAALGRAYTHIDRIDFLEGADSDRIREWRFNLVTNYQFTEGRFKGVGIGGAYRWEDEAIVSYANKSVVIDPGTPFETTVTVPDFDNPHISPAESNVDAWVSYRRKIFSDKIDWRLQLNVKNITADGNGLLPITFTPTGTPTAFMTTPTRTWWLSSSFRF